MTEEISQQADRLRPDELWVKVSERHQIQLPGYLVDEVGCKTSNTEGIRGAKTVWYYHTDHDKVLLADDTLAQESVEPILATPLSGVENEDLDADKVEPARVTIKKDLPDHIHERLRHDEEGLESMVVLRPVFADDHSWLNSTYVSVYPAAEYAAGELPNVDQEEHVRPGADGEEPTVTLQQSHQNSI